MSVINNYHAKPSLNKLGDGKRDWNIFYGIELELEVIDSSEREASGISILNSFKDNFAILKEDSSLKEGHGFEICTSPATLTYHKEKWSRFFDYQVKGIHCPLTCGMHVHISREPLTSLQIGKIISFIYSYNNRDFIRKIAGREEGNKYSEYASNKKHRDSLRKQGRRTAVNLMNSNTIEFRLFAGTISRINFFKNLEFCAALVSFTFPSKYSLTESSDLKNFLNFINNHKNNYEYLSYFLEKEGFLEESPKKSFTRGADCANILKYI